MIKQTHAHLVFQGITLHQELVDGYQYARPECNEWTGEVTLTLHNEKEKGSYKIQRQAGTHHALIAYRRYMKSKVYRNGVRKWETIGRIEIIKNNNKISFNLKPWDTAHTAVSV